MPDEAKFAKLREVGYGIAPCCWVCRHSRFKVPWWGDCDLHRYHHLKHRSPDEGRPVGVHVLGCCPDVEVDPGKLGVLQSHAGFLTGETS